MDTALFALQKQDFDSTITIPSLQRKKRKLRETKTFSQVVDVDSKSSPPDLKGRGTVVQSGKEAREMWVE